MALVSTSADGLVAPVAHLDISGLEFVKQLSERPNTVVFAGARNPKAASYIQTLSAKYPSRVHVVELRSCDEQGNARVIEEIRQKVGQLDVVIANAGERAS